LNGKVEITWSHMDTSMSNSQENGTVYSRSQFEHSEELEQQLSFVLSHSKYRRGMACHLPTEEEKVDRYNSTKVLQMALKSDFSGDALTTLQNYQ
jgi:hypothetical protein